MSAKGVGPRISAQWTRWYTRRLPSHVAAGRQVEIDSDLWEQRTDSEESSQSRTRFNFAVIGRTLAGVPADLTWRRGVLQSQPLRPALGTRIHDRSDQLVVVLAAIGSLPSTMLLPLLAMVGSEEGGASRGEVLWVLGAVALAGLLIAGLILRVRQTRPRLATAMLVLGAPAPSLAFFWLPPIYLLSLGILGTALASASSHSSRTPVTT